MASTSKQGKHVVLRLFVYLAALVLFTHMLSASPPPPFTATPSQFTLSNTVIDLGQTSVANTVVSGGSLGPYFGQWTWSSGNMVNNQVTNTITAGTNPFDISFNPSGTLAYVTNYGSGTVSLIDTATNTITNTINVGTNPEGVSLNSQGTLAYVVNDGSGTVNVINTATNTVINTITVGATPTGIAFNPSGTLAYVTNEGSGTANVIDVATNTVINTITVGTTPEGVAFNPSGTLAYVTNEGSGTVNVINPATNTIINTITVGTSPTGVTFSPSGTFAYVANDGSGTVNVIDVSTNTVINTIASGGTSEGVSFNPSGTLAYVANYGYGTVNVINTATNTVINTITVGTNPIGISFNPSGTSAYVTNYGSGTVSVIGNLPETAQQPLPASNDLQLILNAVSSNELSVTFNGITYTESTGTHTLYGPWFLYGFADDSNGIGGSDGGFASQTFYGVGNTLTSSNTLTINPALSTPTISPSNPIIDIGQSITLTGSWTGGSPTYTIKWYTGPSGNTCSEDSANILATYSSLTGTSNSIQISPTSANSYCISVTDSASTPVTTNSAISEVTVGPKLTVPLISPSNPTITTGQSVTFSSSWSGGRPPYVASLYSSSTSACSQQSTLVQQQIGISSNSAVFSPVVPSDNAYYCVSIADNTIGAYSISSSIFPGLTLPNGVAFFPLGEYAYVTNGGSSNNVLIINTATNTIASFITSGFYHPHEIAFSPSGTYAYVVNSGSPNVVIINTATNTISSSITSGLSNPLGVAFSPSGTYAYVTNGASHNVVIINTATNTITSSIVSPGLASPMGVAFSPSGTYAYITNYNSNNVVIINTATNTIASSITSGFDKPIGVAFSTSGAYAYVVNYNTNNVVVINTATNAVTGSITSGVDAPTGVAFSPSGSYGYVANQGSNNNVIVINTGTDITSSISSYVSLKAATNQVSNPYAGGSTGFFGNLPGATTATTSASSTSTTTVHTTAPAGPHPVTTSGVSERLCNDTSGYDVNYHPLNATFSVKPGIKSCFNITASSASPKSFPSLLNRSAIKVINYTFSNRNISVNVTMHYPCTTPASDITPFILRNGTWQEITPFTVNVAACTVTFAAPADPVIALFNTNSTSATTTLNTTTTEPATTAPAPGQQQSNTGIIVAVVIIVAIILIAIVAYLKMKR